MNTKAVRIYGKQDLRLEEFPLPEVGPDDVQIRVISDSVCMSSGPVFPDISASFSKNHAALH